MTVVTQVAASTRHRISLRTYNVDIQLLDLPSGRSRRLTTSPAADLVEAVFVRSQGNPFFTEELLAAVRAGSGGLPVTVRDLLQGRIDGLPDQPKQVLRVAAVAGRQDQG